MEQNRFFVIVSRINSLLILIAAVGAVIAVFSLSIMSNSWGNRNTVEVVDEENGEESLELRLGNLDEMTGHEVQTVNLTSDKPSRGFSSGYGGSDIRNVLFLAGEKLDAKWLYEKNSYLITCFCKLQASNKYNGDDPVLAVYVSVVKEDSNGDKELSDRDGIVLALMNPDGSNYKEVSSGITKVMDSTVTDGGENVTFLVQIDTRVLARKYSLKTFSLVSEREISEISKKL
ncbi:hypothetical protein [Marinobacter nitratireducens]|uniref:hypothetical protein n=1 Tax=Marinobacter nitratireducens TaxID=1137280 RepID=UPI000569BFBF|nr:hypothetical protein [Marinobacter nitratireducens]